MTAVETLENRVHRGKQREEEYRVTRRNQVTTVPSRVKCRSGVKKKEKRKRKKRERKEIVSDKRPSRV